MKSKAPAPTTRPTPAAKAKAPPKKPIQEEPTHFVVAKVIAKTAPKRGAPAEETPIRGAEWRIEQGGKAVAAGTTSADGLIRHQTKQGTFSIKLLKVPSCADADLPKAVSYASVPRATDATTRRIPVDLLTVVELFLFNERGSAHAEAAYELTFPDGEKRTGKTRGGGHLREEKKGPVEKVKVKFTPKGAKKPLEREVWVDAGDIATEEGVKRRLHNLGFDVTKFHEAVRRFELSYGLPADGLIDGNMTRALEEAHEGRGFMKKPLASSVGGGGGGPRFKEHYVPPVESRG
jgi:hypothetical protein